MVGKRKVWTIYIKCSFETAINKNFLNCVFILIGAIFLCNWLQDQYCSDFSQRHGVLIKIKFGQNCYIFSTKFRTKSTFFRSVFSVSKRNSEQNQFCSEFFFSFSKRISEQNPFCSEFFFFSNRKFWTKSIVQNYFFLVEKWNFEQNQFCWKQSLKRHRLKRQNWKRYSLQKKKVVWNDIVCKGGVWKDIVFKKTCLKRHSLQSLGLSGQCLKKESL